MWIGNYFPFGARPILSCYIILFIFVLEGVDKIRHEIDLRRFNSKGESMLMIDWNQRSTTALCGCFQKKWYPQIINFNRAFHYFHHPFWVSPIFGSTPMWIQFPSTFFEEKKVWHWDVCPPRNPKINNPERKVSGLWFYHFRSWYPPWN